MGWGLIEGLPLVGGHHGVARGNPVQCLGTPTAFLARPLTSTPTPQPLSLPSLPHKLLPGGCSPAGWPVAPMVRADAQRGGGLCMGRGRVSGVPCAATLGPQQTRTLCVGVCSSVIASFCVSAHCSGLGYRPHCSLCCWGCRGTTESVVLGGGSWGKFGQKAVPPQRGALQCRSTPSGCTPLRGVSQCATVQQWGGGG